MRRILMAGFLVAGLLMAAGHADALDLTSGLMMALPLPGGRPPVIDGKLDDWDLSAQEPMWITPETADRFNAGTAIMYDSQALYFSAVVSLPDRPLVNANNPVDPFWNGDMLELRLVSDPAIDWPVNAEAANVRASRSIVHCSLWQNSATGKNYIHMAYGARLNQGKAVNPEGSQVALTQNANRQYILESRIPWSALNVPDGKNPFGVGRRMTAVMAVHWGGETQVTALYRVNPGSFAFKRPECWGQVEFSKTGKIDARHATMESAIESQRPRHDGVPIEIDVPENNLKVSVNILGERGEVLREVIGGEPHDKGTLRVRWDGRDQWGAPLTPGTYKWGAYLSPGLKARYVGTVGTSGGRGFETEDGRGLWGGDHGAAVGVAADATGMYFLWAVAESGRAVVKTDYDGNVLWRKTPFVGGGFGPFYAIAANGQYVYIAHESDDWQLLARLDAGTGELLTFPNGQSLARIARGKLIKMPEDTTPLLTVRRMPPVTAGLAASEREIFMPQYPENVIHVVDAMTGKVTRNLRCPGPRGVALDGLGDLYAVSFPENGPARIVKFTGADGEPATVISTDLVAPWCVAVDSADNLHVTDLGKSQQVKIFSSSGRLLRTLGKVGGRPWGGAYDASSFLLPAGISADAKGGILVAEASLPKVMSRFDAANGKLLRRWFGAVAYASQNTPDPLDPALQYYQVTPDGEHRKALGGGICRARVPFESPDAYWYLPRLGGQNVGNLSDYFGSPVTVLADNHQTYIFGDSGHGVLRIDADRLVPVGSLIPRSRGGPLAVWSDANADGLSQPGEIQTLDVIGGQSIGRLGNSAGSMWMQPNGDVYLMTCSNRILKIPGAGFTASGAIRWDVAKASWVVPVVAANMPTENNKWNTSPRNGLLGVRVDHEGNIYVCYNANAPYAAGGMTESMREGLGHTSGMTAVKIGKFSPDGKPLWTVGRKATAAARPGEMYHFWAMGGLVGNRYIAGASEWGQIYFYTHDGFFVDAIMNNPGLSPPAGPYTFGSETFGGRVQDYPQRNEVWAFSCGMSYQVQGFDHGKVAGEIRQSGVVTLDRVYDNTPVAQSDRPVALTAARISADPFSGADAWSNTPRQNIKANGKDLASVQIAFDDANMYARFEVADDSPLLNNADSANLIFHGGDAVGLYLGPAKRSGTAIVPGDMRILAGMIAGKPRLIAMKPTTAQAKRPDRYVTPSGGESSFEFIGDVPQGRVVLTQDSSGNGYTAVLAVPRSFIEIPMQEGKSLAADAEVLFSGQAARGLQTVSRYYIFSPRNSRTNMIDDIPTESRLYPQHWGVLNIQGR